MSAASSRSLPPPRRPRVAGRAGIAVAAGALALAVGPFTIVAAACGSSGARGPETDAGAATGSGSEAGAANDGFKVFIVPDMEGMAGTVFGREVLSGSEAGCETCFTSPDYERYREILAGDANAVIAGAREGGATAFTVNEGHGGNDFANIQPFDLDPEALLIRGWPKPRVMITGLDETFDTIMFVGAHANAGSLGVMAHNFAVDAFAVNGVALNEVGINALMAGQLGVSVSLVSGDDALLEETRAAIGEFEPVATKIAYGRNAAATYTPAHVQRRLREAARAAVRGEREGRYAPFALEKPYTVEFTMRRAFADKADQVAGLARYGLERTGPASFRFRTSDAMVIGDLMNDLELIVF